MATRIKVCGHTSPGDAVASAMLGADAVGFVHGFPDSPRNVGEATARQIYRSVPPFSQPVAVLNKSSMGFVDRVRPRIVQLTGEAAYMFAASSSHPDVVVIPVVGVDEREPAPDVARLFSEFKFVVVDTASPGGGGSGRVHDWNVSRRLSKEWGNVILAGGLKAENVAEAIRVVEPYGVDVSSGVESAPGVKDAEKVRRFVEVVRKYG